jgi:radical SAM superfamily enzyme YgiQ (UPF0313 family)
MHSANFCADHDWVERFCRVYREERCAFPWTSCTRIDQLDPSLIHIMAGAGCIRIGLGVETLSFMKERGPKATIRKLAKVVSWLDEGGIAAKAYIMAGYPGQTELDLLHTYLTCQELNLVPRVSTYTPFQELERLSLRDLERIDLSTYDRKCFLPGSGIPHTTILRLAVRASGVETWAKDRYRELLESSLPRFLSHSAARH